MAKPKNKLKKAPLVQRDIQTAKTVSEYRDWVVPVSKTKAEGGKSFTEQTKLDDPLGRRLYDQNLNNRAIVNRSLKKGGSTFDLAPPKKQKIKKPSLPRRKK